MTVLTVFAQFQAMIRVVRAHSNHFTDDVIPMWCDLFDSTTVANCTIRLLGILDRYTGPDLYVHNQFSDDDEYRLKLSTLRTETELVTQVHADE